MEFTILLTLFFLSLSALFSASETALFSIGREQIPLLRAGDKRSKAVYELLSRGEDTLIIILLGNLFVNLSIVSGISKIIASIPESSLLMTFLGSTIILLLFGEIVPKNIAISYATSISRLTAPILLGMLRLSMPVITLMSGINRTLLRFNYHYLLHSPAPFITSDEYNTALDLAVDREELSKGSAQFLSFLLNSSQTPLQAIATHRSKILTFEGGTKRQKIVASLSHGKIAILEKRESVEIEALFFEGKEYEPRWFPISRSCTDLLQCMKTLNTSVLLLTDEYGSFYGAITLEAILRYWRGEVDDREEIVQSERIYLKGDDKIILYKALFPQKMLEKGGDVKSVNGLITAWLEAIPQSGDTFQVESCIFRIVKAQKNRVIEIILERSDEK